MTDTIGCSRATQMLMETPETVELTEFHPRQQNIIQVKGVNDSRLLVNALDG